MPVAAAAPTVEATVIDGTLRISGSPRADEIVLRLRALDPNQLQVDVGDNGWADATFDVATLRAIDVEAGNGNDTVRIDQVNGAFTTRLATRIDGWNGDDTLIGGSGDEIFVGGRGDDFVDGNGGSDTAFLGKGDDTFVWDPGDGSDVVEGGRGSDTQVQRVRRQRDHGRNGRRRASVVHAEPWQHRHGPRWDRGIDVRALGGTDTVTVNDVGGTDLKRVDIDLAATISGSTADGQADTVTVAATKGDDSIAVDANGGAVDVSGLAAFVRITHADHTPSGSSTQAGHAYRDR